MNRYSNIRKLCNIAPNSLGRSLDCIDTGKLFEGLSKIGEELQYLLSEKNGFYAFESALHVFPYELNGFGDQDLVRWNSRETWKSSYGPEIESIFCFAEDLFGYQFCSNGKSVNRFDPETGDTQYLCDSVDDWARLIISDCNVQTGFPVALKWKEQKGSLQPGKRLLPIFPFITDQGSYEISNLYEIEAVAGMLSRASFARQIKHLPDKTIIKMDVINPPKTDPRS